MQNSFAITLIKFMRNEKRKCKSEMTFHKPSWCWNRNIAGELGQYNGPFVRYVKLRVAHAPGIPGTFFPPSRVSNPDMHHGTCVTHMLWCMSGSLTGGSLWIRWRGKRYRHSLRMRNPQFYLVRGPWSQYAVMVCHFGRSLCFRGEGFTYPPIAVWRNTNIFS